MQTSNCQKMLRDIEWKVPSAECTLGNNDVHVWRCLSSSFSEGLDRVATFLSQEERERADRFHRNRDREQYIISHGALRSILSSYCHLHPKKIEFSSNQYGKPYLENCTFPSLRFSLSHCSGMTLIGVAHRGEIGVDVERRRQVPEALDIARSYFTKREVRLLRTLPNESVEAMFFYLWTRKEACVKAAGIGLAQSLQSFDVSCRQEGYLELTSSGHKSHLTVSLTSFNPGKYYYGAIAVEQSRYNLSFYEFS